MITETSVTLFTEQVRKRGKALEQRVIDYLKSSNIPYNYNTHNGIDFIINGDIHMDCCAQGVSGSIGDKVPHKVYKYARKYNLKDIYILHPYSPITQNVAMHLMDLEKWLDCKIHIIGWDDFTYLMQGGKFFVRKPYNSVKNSAQISSGITNPITHNKFFDFKTN